MKFRNMQNSPLIRSQCTSIVTAVSVQVFYFLFMRGRNFSESTSQFNLNGKVEIISSIPRIVIINVQKMYTKYGLPGLVFSSLHKKNFNNVHYPILIIYNPTVRCVKNVVELLKSTSVGALDQTLCC